jgi:hypothetical protein
VNYGFACANREIGVPGAVHMAHIGGLIFGLAGKKNEGFLGLLSELQVEPAPGYASSE